MKHKIFSLIILLMLGSFSFPDSNACCKQQHPCKAKLKKLAAKNNTMPWADFMPMNYIMLQ